jgi:hypothetical protein
MENEFKDLEVKSKVTVLELRRLLVGVNEHQLDTGFRYRVVGELWHPIFLTVISVSDQNVLLLDQQSNKLISVNFTMIMQFEIDLRYQEFSPNFHYSLTHLA